LALPWDLVDAKIITKRLSEIKLSPQGVEIDADAEKAAIDHIYRRFEEAFSGELEDNVVVLADVSISRHHCKKEAADFLSVTNLPVYGTPLGKTVVDETSERYGGVSARKLLRYLEITHNTLLRFTSGSLVLMRLNRRSSRRSLFSS
jgi:pyruvate decarboxylase